MINKPEKPFSVKNWGKEDPMSCMLTKPSSFIFLNTYLLQEQ